MPNNNNPNASYWNDDDYNRRVTRRNQQDQRNNRQPMQKDDSYYDDNDGYSRPYRDDYNRNSRGDDRWDDSAMWPSREDYGVSYDPNDSRNYPQQRNSSRGRSYDEFTREQQVSQVSSQRYRRDDYDGRAILDSRKYRSYRMEDYESTSEIYAPRDWSGASARVHQNQTASAPKKKHFAKLRAFIYKITPLPRGAKQRLAVIYEGNTAYDRRLRLAITTLILLTIITPTLLVGIAGYTEFKQMKTLASNGVNSLLALQTIEKNATKSVNPTLGFEAKLGAVIQAPVLAQMKQQAQAANSDFSQLYAMLSQRQGLITVAGIPFNSEVVSVTNLAKMGVDATQALIDFIGFAPNLAPLTKGSLLSQGGSPIFTPTIFNNLQSLITQIKPLVDDMGASFNSVNFSQLQIAMSAKQKSEIAAIIPLEPKIISGFDLVANNLPAIRWILGVDSPRTFLLQTMDNGEIRPTGGFTGQYGLLTINGGRLGKISLTDVSNIDFANKNPFYAPAPYNSWWPEGQYGMRDANLSADFPTSAKMIMTAFQNDTGVKVDGVIDLSIFVIENLMAPNILGSVTLPCYDITVDPAHLMNLIHNFQLGFGQYYQMQQKCIANPDTSMRKQFTASLAGALQDKLRTASPAVQQAALQVAVTDWGQKEIETYFTQTQAESLLQTLKLTAAMATSPASDYTTVIQANVGANKGSIYVTTNINEKITLDAQGNATHTLSIVLYYAPTGDVFGYKNVVTMRDYIRVYVNPNSKLMSGSGFDQTQDAPLCAVGSCVPQGAPVCKVTSSNPSGIFDPGPIIPSIGHLEGAGNGFLDSIAGPTNTTSDLPGLDMYGGLVVIPAYCTATVTLQWTTPHVAGSAANGNLPYSFTMQRQSDTFNNVTVQVQPASGVTTAPLLIHVPVFQNDSTWKMG